MCLSFENRVRFSKERGGRLRRMGARLERNLKLILDKRK